MNIFVINFNIMMKQMVEAILITCAFIIGQLGEDNMRIIALSVICFVIGIWVGKKLADHKWISNATESYPIKYKDWLYKVECEKKPEYPS